ncbi:MAG TPA: GAP family protein, partial [Propionibacteriaceae bacterium]|nr:GAP family protein [Propionibacteriaceae bacterium]
RLENVGSVIGEILPLAVGIAISPIPIIAAILMLLSPKAKTTSIGFLLGWLAGIVIAIVLFTVLSSVLPQQDASGSSPVAGAIKIILGVLLLFLAAKQWRGRPAEGEHAAMPKWMSAIDSMTAAKGLGLGFLLSAVNPKNLLLAISAGLIIGGANLSLGDTTVVIVVFVLLAGCTVLVPVIGYLIASARMAGPLDSLRGWLVDNNATIMAILLLVIGVAVIGKGIANF